MTAHRIQQPDFRGDTVRFVKRDGQGNVIEHGFMRRAFILAAAAAGSVSGYSIEEVPDDHEVPQIQAADASQSFQPTWPLDALRNAIVSELNATDRHFLLDSQLDNDKRRKWLDYRAVLRRAHNAGSFEDALALLPADPKGVDRFAAYRQGGST